MTFKAVHGAGGDEDIQDRFFYGFDRADDQRVEGEIGEDVEAVGVSI